MLYQQNDEERAFQSKLLEWYHINKRSMPWRDDPKPYHVWISEIMLQQTRVEAVREYYQRFLERLPDVKSLSEVDDEVLHKLWEGLGYYNRAKHLKKAAIILESEYGGELPASYEELLKLPGIGAYTAGAIASIAFQKPVPAVDGNVMRVIARIFGDDGDISESKTKKSMEVRVRRLIPVLEVRHFNQALMELGALICVPNGKPKCEACPLKENCFAFREGRQAVLPVKKTKKERKKEKRTVLIFRNEAGAFYIRKRGAKGLLSGLWELPSLEGEFTENEIKTLLNESGLPFCGIKKLERAKHIFTHIEWDMSSFLIDVKYTAELDIDRLFEKNEENFSKETKEKEVWEKYTAIIEKYSIPSAFRTFLKQMEKTSV